MKREGETMKLLKIENSCGFFLQQNGDYCTVDKISKEELLRLVEIVLSDVVVDFDAYDENTMQNHAHQVIYKSVFLKLQELLERKQEFVDESARLYLDDYNSYKTSS